MSYGRFHLLYNCTLLILLGILTRSWERGWDWWWPVLVVLVVVYLFTIPWDNYAAFRGIWGFPRDRYSMRIGWLPVEEYAFFGLQSLQSILLTMLFLDMASVLQPGEASLAPEILAACGVVGLLWIGVGLAGRRINATSRWHYAWHLLFWFLPVFAMLALIGWHVLMPLWPVWLATTLVLGTYLTAADLHAVHLGIWHFDERQITGVRLFRILPWEEAAFFYLTSALVSWSYLLLLPGSLR